jgi:hypothetical protein
MGGLPTQSDLLSRKKDAEDKLLKLKRSYDNFIDFWEQFQREETGLLKELHNHLDKEKLKVILKHIDNN